MSAASVTTTDIAVYLSIYASIVATMVGLWTLFAGVFRDRARISVKAREGYLVKTTSGGKEGHLLIRGDDILKTMGVTEGQRRPVMEILVRNRGRRDARITTISQVTESGHHYVFADAFTQAPFDLRAETSKSIIFGQDGGYTFGDISPKRFYAVDDAGRSHPLRQRFRLRWEYLRKKFRRNQSAS